MKEDNYYKPGFIDISSLDEIDIIGKEFFIFLIILYMKSNII